MDKQFECTSCSKIIKSGFDANLHPHLDCLVCRKCYNDYGTGDFSKIPNGIDENGDDNYCRWCVDGGELFGCMNVSQNGDTCHYAFCEECVRKHVPNDRCLRINEMPKAEYDTYTFICFVCDKSRIDYLRQEAKEAMEYFNKLEMKDSEATELEPSPIKKKKTSDQAPPGNGQAPSAKKSVNETETRSAKKKDAGKPATSTNGRASPTRKTGDQPETADSTKKKDASELESSHEDQASTGKRVRLDGSISILNKKKGTSEQPPSTSDESSMSKKTPIDQPGKPIPKTKKKVSSNNNNRYYLTDLPVNSEPTKAKDSSDKNKADTGKLSFPQIEIPEKSRKDNAKSMQPHSKNKDGRDSFFVKKPAIKEIALSETELIRRLDAHIRNSDTCVGEVGRGIGVIAEKMKNFKRDKDPTSMKEVLRMKIDALEKPLRDFENIVRDLKKLNQCL